MNINEDNYYQTTMHQIESCLESLSYKYGFYFSVIDMREMKNNLTEEKSSFFSVLSIAELEYYNNLRIPKNRLQWLAGRYTVKSAFFKYKFDRQSIMDLSCIDVLKGENSAPYILQYPSMNVSITHSFPFCVGIVCKSKIGIDIEKIFEYPYIFIKHYFSIDEKEELSKKENSFRYFEQSIIFWTRKEAVSKLLGLGMKMNFKELDTSKDIMHLKYPSIESLKLSSHVCNDFCLSFAIE